MFGCVELAAPVREPVGESGEHLVGKRSICSRESASIRMPACSELREIHVIDKQRFAREGRVPAD